MPFDRRFALPSYNEFDDFLLPECDDCEQDPCEKEDMDKCEHWIKFVEEQSLMAEAEAQFYEEMEAIKEDDYEGWLKKHGNKRSDRHRRNI